MASNPPPRTMPYGQKQRKRRGYKISPQGTVPGTNGARSWDKPGPVQGTNRPVSAEFHGKIGILSRLSLGWAGVRPWDDCPARAVRKMFMCFVFNWFFRPQIRGTNNA